MPTLRTGLIATAVALVASAATVAATQSSGHAAPPFPVPVAESGIATLHTDVDLAPNTWTSIPLQVHLPHAGTYEVDANVRGRLQGTSPINTYITARLWNVTANQEAIYSDRLVYQVINYDTQPTISGGNGTAPISELVTVDRPTTIQLQAEDTNNNGKATIAQVISDNYGYTTLRYTRVLP